jgi:hypothetical protein
MSKRPNKDKSEKRTLMMPKSFIKDLAEIRLKTGATSDSEVIRRAFRLYKQLILDEKELVRIDPKTGEAVKIILA